MNIAILGFGGQGKSSYEYWNKPENKITICDSNEDTDVPKDCDAKLGSDYLADLNKFDLLARTPSIHPNDIEKANPDYPDILDKVWSNTNEFMKVCPSKNIIGVTGTKGKGTTSTLITKILETSGKKVHLGGNIGTPPLDMLKDNIKPDDWVVLELANFQLIDLAISPRIAVCVMVVPEHLNWHTDFDEYKRAKMGLFKYQTETDMAMFFADNIDSIEIANASPSHNKKSYSVTKSDTTVHIAEGKIYYKDIEVCSVHDIKLLGEHNWQNVCAAIAATWEIVNGDVDVIREVISTFSGLPYRIEFRREINGVKYYNDSFATTPETAIAAIKSFSQPKIVILGGSEKGVAYEELAQEIVKNNVKNVLAIGETGKIIAKLLQKNKFEAVITKNLNNMSDIVNTAHKIAKKGDVVLLSTASASFDMFKNYKDRGDQFNRAVELLI